MQPIYYTVDSATLPSAGVSTVSFLQNLNNAVSAGTTVYFLRVSLQITSSHSFEWVGSGNDINRAKPALGGVVIPENEVVQENGGRVVYTSTDQAGNFKIGDGVIINQSTGQISGRDFTKALFTTMTPFILALAE
jgi:co-chaperonin GroES (HSP10)